jgi:hypothetical protein
MHSSIRHILQIMQSMSRQAAQRLTRIPFSHNRVQQLY